MVASDNGKPARSATAIVYVTVERNFYAPQWDQTNYQVRLQETQPLGISFLKVVARDKDRAVSINLYLLTVSYSFVDFFS